MSDSPLGSPVRYSSIPLLAPNYRMHSSAMPFFRRSSGKQENIDRRVKEDADTGAGKEEGRSSTSAFAPEPSSSPAFTPQDSSSPESKPQSSSSPAYMPQPSSSQHDVTLNDNTVLDTFLEQHGPFSGAHDFTISEASFVDKSIQVKAGEGYLFAAGVSGMALVNKLETYVPSLRIPSVSGYSKQWHATDLMANNNGMSRFALQSYMIAVYTQHAGRMTGTKAIMLWGIMFATLLSQVAA